MILAALLSTFALFLLFCLWRASIRSHRISFPTWSELAGRIQPVQRDGIRALAKDYLEPTAATSGRSQEEIWDMLGGAEGLKRMKENAAILIELASYAQRWNHGESIIVAERMRRDGQALRRAVVGLGIALTFGYGRERVLAYLLEAASAYHLMRQRLLALYKTSHEGIYPKLLDSI